MRFPYHYDPILNRFYRYSWPYLLFSQFAWYRWVVGGDWEYMQPDPNSDYWTWMRMKDVDLKEWPVLQEKK